MTGKEFKKLRNEWGWSGTTLCTMLDVTDRTIRRWEAAKTVPRIAEIAITWLTEQNPKRPPLTGIKIKRGAGVTYRDYVWLTTEEAAEYLGISRRTLLEWKKAGRVPEPEDAYREIGGQSRKVAVYRKEDLDRIDSDGRIGVADVSERRD